MEKHYGQIVEHRVRKNGYSISDLAKNLQVNRRSVYNWFNQRNLKKDVILNIGCVIRHSFALEIPEMFSDEDFNCIYDTQTKGCVRVTKNDIDINDYKNKYISLLEQYNELLLNSGQ